MVVDKSCNSVVAGSIPAFPSLSVETKPWPCHHMTLAVGGTLNTNKHFKSNLTLQKYYTYKIPQA